MRKTLTTATLSLALLLGGTAALAVDFSFNGSTDSGPLAASAFSGSFSYDGDTVPADGDALLTAFSMAFAGQTYTLASAIGMPAAVFSAGSFIGLSFLDDASTDTALRPKVAFVPGAFGLVDAYLAYEGAGGLGGFGSYTISVVPEPASAWLLLAGFGLLAVRWGTRRSAAR